MPTEELERLREQDALLREQARAKRPGAAGRPEEDEKFGWERTREAYERAGSYAELRHALEWLRERHWMEDAALHSWRESRQNPAMWETSEGLEVFARRGMKLLAGRMGEPIRVPWWIVRAREDEAA